MSYLCNLFGSLHRPTKSEHGPCFAAIRMASNKRSYSTLATRRERPVRKEGYAFGGGMASTKDSSCRNFSSFYTTNSRGGWRSYTS